LAERRKIEQVSIELRVRGFGFDEIAEALSKKHGISCSAFRAEVLCDKALARAPTTSANHLRAIEYKRLNLLVREFLAVFMNSETAFHDRYKAASMLIKISERTSTMLGLNMQPIFTTSATAQAAEITQNLTKFMKDVSRSNANADETETDYPAEEEDTLEG
jgi:hypothetical protein